MVHLVYHERYLPILILGNTQLKHQSFQRQIILSTVFYPLPDFLLKRLQRLQFAAASFARGRYVWDFSLLKLVHKALYMNIYSSLRTLLSSSAARLSNHRSSGTICPVKYLALTLFQILTAMLKHIFLNKLLICSRVFISFIILFIVLFYFTFFYLLLGCKFLSQIFYLLVTFIHFQSFNLL